MQIGAIAKYIFKIRTRNGVLVEHLSVYGKDEDDARAKVAQIYKHCEVLECELQVPSVLGRAGRPLNYEEVVDLISAS